MARCSAFSSARIVWIGNGEVARFHKNHSVVVSSLGVVLAPGDPALPVPGSRFQHRLPVAYSEIGYSGFGLFCSNFAVAASKACMVLTALGDLEIRSASSGIRRILLLILSRASSSCS